MPHLRILKYRTWPTVSLDYELYISSIINKHGVYIALFIVEITCMMYRREYDHQ